MTEHELPGRRALLAKFTDATQLVAATRLAWASGYRRMDAYAPFPLEELEPLLPQNASRVSWIACCGGLFGALLGIFIQILPALTYPLNIGGRPVIALPSLMVVTFLLSVLFAAAAALLGLLWCSRLPRLNHPVFAADEFERTCDDRFFLCIYADDEQFDPIGTAAWLRAQALDVSEVAS